MAQTYGALFQETSAQTGEGVEAIFGRAARAGWDKKKAKDQRKIAGISINSDGGSSESGKCQC